MQFDKVSEFFAQSQQEGHKFLTGGEIKKGVSVDRYNINNRSLTRPVMTFSRFADRLLCASISG